MVFLSASEQQTPVLNNGTQATSKNFFRKMRKHFGSRTPETIAAQSTHALA
jgi:hypothetical protein